MGTPFLNVDRTDLAVLLDRWNGSSVSADSIKLANHIFSFLKCFFFAVPSLDALFELIIENE